MRCVSLLHAGFCAVWYLGSSLSPAICITWVIMRKWFYVWMGQYCLSWIFLIKIIRLTWNYKNITTFFYFRFNFSCSVCFCFVSKMSLDEPWSHLKMSLDELYTCAGLGQKRVHFLHSGLFRTVFWICVGNSFDNTGDFLYFWADFTQSQSLFCLLPSSVGQGEHKELGGVMARTADPNQSRDIPDLMASPSAYEAGGGGGEEKGNMCVGKAEWWHLCS